MYVWRLFWTYICVKRPMYVERDLYMWKETYICGKRPIYVERDLYMWKETCICGKRPILVERDLYLWENSYIRRATCCTCTSGVSFDVRGFVLTFVALF